MIKIEVKESRLPWLIGIGTILTGVIVAALSIVYAKDSAYVRNFYADGADYPVKMPFSDAITVLAVLLIILAGAALCLCARNRGIMVQGESLCYKNCCGRTKDFSLSEVGYCRAALENGGSRDYLILYDVSGAKLCKLELGMRNADVFLQYLLDNEIKVECSQKSDLYLKWMVNTRPVNPKEAALAVNEAYERMEELIAEWVKKNKDFGAEWKFGIACYMEDKFVQGKQLWEQEASPAVKALWEDKPDGLSAGFGGEGVPMNLPEGFFIVMEGYLQKDGRFVIDKKNQAVSISAKLMQVSKSFRAGEALKIYFYNDAVEYISNQLSYYEEILPKRRYHTELLTLKHELLDGMPNPIKHQP